MTAELSLRTKIKDDASYIDRLQTIADVNGEHSFSGNRDLKLATNRYDIFSTTIKQSNINTESQDSSEMERKDSNIFFHEGM